MLPSSGYRLRLSEPGRAPPQQRYSLLSYGRPLRSRRAALNLPGMRMGKWLNPGVPPFAELLGSLCLHQSPLKLTPPVARRGEASFDCLRHFVLLCHNHHLTCTSHGCCHHPVCCSFCLQASSWVRDLSCCPWGVRTAPSFLLGRTCKTNRFRDG